MICKSLHSVIFFLHSVPTFLELGFIHAPFTFQNKIKVHFSLCTAEGRLDLSLSLGCEVSGNALWLRTACLPRRILSNKLSLIGNSHFLRMTQLDLERFEQNSLASLFISSSYLSVTSFCTFLWLIFHVSAHIMKDTLGWRCPFLRSGALLSCCPEKCRDASRNVDSQENLAAEAGVFGRHPSLCLSGALLPKGWAPLLPLYTPCSPLT